jgi:myosin heavy subunit
MIDPTTHDLGKEAEPCYWIKTDKAAPSPFLKVTLMPANLDGQCMVKDDHGGEHIIADKESLFRGVSSKFALLEDNAMLPELSEPTVLDNMLQRYARNLIYTKSGLFLVAINPYQTMDDTTYNAAVQSAYAKSEEYNDHEDDLPPHMYGVVSKAYRDLFRDRQSQSILITYASLLTI